MSIVYVGRSIGIRINLINKNALLTTSVFYALCRVCFNTISDFLVCIIIVNLLNDNK